MTTVVAWHLDRLVRRGGDLQRLLDGPDIEVRVVSGSNFRTRDASGARMAPGLTATASFESAHKGERVQAAARARAEFGRLACGGVYGYRDGVPVARKPPRSARFSRC